MNLSLKHLGITWGLILVLAAGCMNPAQKRSIQRLMDRANRGDVQSQFILGLLYSAGQGVKKDDAEALKWFRMAADQGYPKAQFNLGARLQYNANATTNDLTDAAAWYRKAAEQGLVEAQVNLAALYADGKGVSKDLVRAYRWAGIAALEMNYDAITLRDHYAKLLTPSQLARAKREIRAWKPSSSRHL